MKKCEKGDSLRGDWLFNLHIKDKRKNPYFWKPCILLFVVLWFCGGCQKQDWFESDESGVGLPVEEARAFFENDVVGIMTRSTERDKAYYARRFMLPVGDITPQWGKGVSTKGKRLLSVDVPVETTYRYRGVWTNPSTGEKQTVSCSHKLVVIKNTETGKMDSYIVFFIGDAGYSKAHKGDISKRFNNGGNMGDFTGVKIYTRLDGRIARVNRYEEGLKVGGVFIGEATDAKDYTRRLVAALNMMKHLAIQQGVRKGLMTRSSDENDGEYWDCDGDYLDIGNGFFYDEFHGVIWYDLDGDGSPDTVWVPVVEVTPDDPGGDDDPWGDEPDDWEDPDDCEEGDSGYDEGDGSYILSIDPNMLGQAAVTSGGNLMFQDSDFIAAENLEHEWFHLLQRYDSNIDVFDPANTGMAEFENALLGDIIECVNIGGDFDNTTTTHSFACYYTGENNYRTAYQNWLKFLTSNGTTYPTTISINDFRYWANIFGDIDPSYNKDRGFQYDNTSYQPVSITNLLTYALNNCQ